MARAPSQLIDVATRHQVFLERLKSHEAAKFEAFLRAMDRDLLRQLAGKDLTAYKIQRLNTLLAAVRKGMHGHWEGYWKQLRSGAVELAAYEAGFEARTLGQVTGRAFAVPTTNQLMTAALAAPLGVTGANGGQLLEPFFRDWSNRTIMRVEGAIRLAAAQGQTTGQLLQTLRGTRARGFQDGILANANVSAKWIARTTLQHVAVQAREQTWQANSDIVKKVRWISTLDDRTTDICQALDGREYPLDDGPRPPAHIGCRSTVVAVLDERFSALRTGATRAARGEDGQVVKVPARQTYYGWLKEQPAAFQDAAIGPTRARLLRDGGLSAQRFSELRLGKDFRPLSLREMRLLEPVAFERAGLLAKSSISPTTSIAALPAGAEAINVKGMSLYRASEHAGLRVASGGHAALGEGVYFGDTRKGVAGYGGTIREYKVTGKLLDVQGDKGYDQIRALAKADADKKLGAYLKDVSAGSTQLDPARVARLASPETVVTDYLKGKGFDGVFYHAVDRLNDHDTQILVFNPKRVTLKK